MSDIIHLVVDAASRHGFDEYELTDMLDMKQRKNQRREWPDWRKAEPGKAIEHVRDGDNK